MTDSIWDDARITSYVLDELPDEARSTFEAEMSDNQQLKNAVEEARDVTDRIDELLKNETARQLDPSRRAQIMDGVVASRQGNPQVSLAEKIFEAPSWGVPVLATAIAASLLLLIGVAPWLRRESTVTAIVPTEDSQNVTQSTTAIAPAASPSSPAGSASLKNSPLQDLAVAKADVELQPKTIELAETESLTLGAPGNDVAASGMVQDKDGGSAIQMKAQTGGSSRADSQSPIPKAGSLGLPDISSLAMDDTASRRSVGRFDRRKDNADTTDDAKKTRAVENFVEMDQPKQDLSRGKTRSRIEDAQTKLADAIRPPSPSSIPEPMTRQLQRATSDQPTAAIVESKASAPALSKAIDRPSGKASANEASANEMADREMPVSEAIGPGAVAGKAAVTRPPESGTKETASPVLNVPETMLLARSSADKLFRGQRVSAAEAEQGVDAEVRALNEKLFGSAKSRRGGMGGAGLAADGDSPSAPPVDNQFQIVAESPTSVFSIQTPSSSYRLARNKVMRLGILPDPGSVRIEEMVNYFDYDYKSPKPDAEHPFAWACSITKCPWNDQNVLARVAIQSATSVPTKRRPCNLVFMMDTSGSMDAPDKAPVVVQALRGLVKQFNGQDRVALIAFADANGVVLESTLATNKNAINKSLTKLSSGGSTEQGEGIELALHIARENFIDGGINRVIICTDGNLGNTKRVRSQIAKEAKKGIGLAVLGFNESMLAGARNRLNLTSDNLHFVLIDSRAEARRQLSRQIMPIPKVIAKDASLQVKFNPDRAEKFRLIGYESHVVRDDLAPQTHGLLEGQSVTALFEIVPVESDSDGKQWLEVNLNYKRPDAKTQATATLTLDQKLTEFDSADADFRFAAAVAGFAMKLRNSKHDGNWTFNDVHSIAKESLGKDPFGIRKEFLQITQMAERLHKSKD